VISLAQTNKDFDKTTTFSEDNVVYHDFGNNNSTIDSKRKDSIELSMNNRMERALLSRYIYENLKQGQYIDSTSSKTYKVQDRGFTTGGDEKMSDLNWQEKYFDNLNNNLREIKSDITNMENRVSEMISKHIENANHLDKQRHDEILSLNKKIDDAVTNINNNSNSTNRWIIGLGITIILGISAMIITFITSVP